jgi:hypothetical protein
MLAVRMAQRSPTGGWIHQRKELPPSREPADRPDAVATRRTAPDAVANRSTSSLLGAGS